MKRLICLFFNHKYRLKTVDVYKYEILVSRNTVLCCDRCKKEFDSIKNLA